MPTTMRKLARTTPGTTKHWGLPSALDAALAVHEEVHRGRAVAADLVGDARMVRVRAPQDAKEAAAGVATGLEEISRPAGPALDGK